MESKEMLERGLSQSPVDVLGLIKQIALKLKELGDNGQAKRDWLNTILDFSIDFYRRQIHEQLPQTSNGEPPLSEQAMADVEISRRALMSCIEAQRDVPKNLNLAGLVESWVCELGLICR